MVQKFKDIDTYHAAFPPTIRKRLDQLRDTIVKNAPEATEAITYSMPGFRLHGVLLCYAAWRNHIGLYAMPSAIRHFEDKLIGYEVSKGTIKLPHDKPLPVELIAEIVRFRVEENHRKNEVKRITKSKK